MESKLSPVKINKFNISETVGRSICYFDSLTSTFDKIREMDLVDGLTVVCSGQTAGSGRLGRKWESPSGGIYFTFAILPPFGGFHIPFITTVCALGVYNALKNYVPCSIKWPNDIVCRGKKLCGILTRNIASEGKISAVLTGIGINANITEFPRELCHATSLKTIIGKDIDENALLKEILEEINKVYLHKSAEEILELYTKNCVNMQKEVTIHYADGRGDVKGTCISILPDGSMNVQTADEILNVHSGEVSVKGIYD